MHRPIAPTALLEPIPCQPIPPNAAARFAAAFRALLRSPTRTVRQPQAVVALATIKTSITGDCRWLHARRHRLQTALRMLPCQRYQKGCALKLEWLQLFHSQRQSFERGNRSFSVTSIGNDLQRVCIWSRKNGQRTGRDWSVRSEGGGRIGDQNEKNTRCTVHSRIRVR